MKPTNADDDLMFGLLALQNGFIQQADLIAAFEAWLAAHDRPLVDYLVDLNILDANQCRVIDGLVAMQVLAREEVSGSDPFESLGLKLPWSEFNKDEDFPTIATLPDATVADSLASSSSDNTLRADTPSRLSGKSGLDDLDSGIRTSMTRVSLENTERWDDATRNGDEDSRPADSRRDSSRAGGQAGRYQLMDEIARGGMGSVIKGRDPDLGRDLALKVLLQEHCERNELVDRFLEEAQICGQLQHPGVVPVYDLGTLSDHRPFFAMKLVKGKTLRELLDERKSVPSADEPTAFETSVRNNPPPAPDSSSTPLPDLPRFLSIFEAVCQTMGYAHARGVIHRDLKPSNVMVGAFGEVQVMDWGLAKVLNQPRPEQHVASPNGVEATIATLRTESNSDFSRPGAVMGTPPYMAPEQARGDSAAIDRRADVFALGSILCEILTGKPAFAFERSLENIRAAERADTAPALDRLNNCGADEELMTLCRDCLAAIPDDRPADAKAVATRVTAYLSGVQERLRQAELDRAAEIARTKEAQAKAAAERRARRLTAALAATVIIAGVLGGAGFRWAELKRLERVQQASDRVGIAVQEATRLRALAQAAAVGDLDPWVVAINAAEKARDLLEPGINPAIRKQVDDLRAVVFVERQNAQAAAVAADNDRQLLARLVDIRSAEADDLGGWTTDAAYADAFRQAGFDLTTLPAEEAGKRLKQRPPEVAITLAASVDDWAALRRDRQKDPGRAAALSAVASAADPDQWRVNLRKALDTRDPAARLNALRSLTRATPFDSVGPISLDLLGRALKDAGDPVAAEAVLRSAQRLHPTDVWINYDLARTLEKLARRDDAIRYYTAARSLRPETAHELAHALSGTGDRDEEIAILEDLKRLRPTNGRHLGCLGRALKSQGRAQEASATLDAAVAANRAVIQKSPDDAYAHYSLAFALHTQGKLDEAANEYRTAIRLQPQTAEFHDNLCELLGRQGKIDEAIAEHKIAIRLQPNFANAHNTLGDILFSRKQDYPAAAAEFREAIRLQSDNATFHDNLGLSLQQQGKIDEALAEYLIASRLKPNYAEIHVGIGEIHEFQGRGEDALAEYRAASRLKPLYADAHNSIARILVNKKDRTAQELVDAVDHARQAAMLRPNEPVFQATLALVEFRAAHWPESIAAAERAIALTEGQDASDAVNALFIAMCLRQQGDKDRALPFFNQAVAWIKQNDPTSAELIPFWREAARLLGQPAPDADLVDIPADPFAP